MSEGILLPRSRARSRCHVLRARIIHARLEPGSGMPFVSCWVLLSERDYRPTKCPAGYLGTTTHQSDQHCEGSCPRSHTVPRCYLRPPAQKAPTAPPPASWQRVLHRMPTWLLVQFGSEVCLLEGFLARRPDGHKPCRVQYALALYHRAARSSTLSQCIAGVGFLTHSSLPPT